MVVQFKKSPTAYFVKRKRKEKKKKNKKQNKQKQKILCLPDLERCQFSG
jgi:hypothetical protein